MAENEAARRTGEPIVIADSPDVCLTPMGSAKVPVPYNIVAYFSDAQLTTPTVMMTRDPAFTTMSYIPSVIGDEAGVDKGVVTGVHAGGGMCHVVDGSHTPVVKAEGNLVVFHSSKMEMNCASPTGPGNTIGTVIWQQTAPYASADSEGNVDGATDPPAEPETPEEVAAATEQPPDGATNDSKWSARNNAEAAGGYDGTTDTGSPYYRTAGTRNSPTPDGGGLVADAKLQAGADRELFNESYRHYGSNDNYVKIGQADATAGAGVIRSADGTTTYGGRVQGHVAAIDAHTEGTTMNGALSGRGDLEVLSATGTGELGVVTGPDGARAVAKAAVEADAVKVSGGGALRITPKTLYDNSIGAAVRWWNPESEWGEASESIDYGVVIGLEVEAGIGAGAAAEAEAGATDDGATASARVSLGLGPKVAVKPSAGVAVPEGTWERASNWIKSWF